MSRERYGLNGAGPVEEIGEAELEAMFPPDAPSFVGMVEIPAPGLVARPRVVSVKDADGNDRTKTIFVANFEEEGMLTDEQIGNDKSKKRVKEKLEEFRSEVGKNRWLRGLKQAVDRGVRNAAFIPAMGTILIFVGGTAFEVSRHGRDIRELFGLIFPHEDK